MESIKRIDLVLTEEQAIRVRDALTLTVNNTMFNPLTEEYIRSVIHQISSKLSKLS